MNGTVTFSARSAEFQRSFVAMRYFWGARGSELTAGLDPAGILPATADAVSSLCQTERAARAHALGIELARLAAALDQRGLWR
jgi:hypothetical protein